ncbi:MAG: lysoplasmalogenase [Treponema sp.]|nr:lysoplasmalogenase [Treponema sp.]
MLSILALIFNGGIKTVFTEAAALSCAAVCIYVRYAVRGRNRLWFLAAAFVFSLFGDLVLKNHAAAGYLIYGILFFSGAHICFFAYALLENRKYSHIVLIASAAVFLFFFISAFLKYPKLGDDMGLAAAVLAYIIITCFSLASAIIPGSRTAAGWIYAAGICSLVVSDILLSASFLGIRNFSFFMMIFYLLSQVLITLSVNRVCP